jgi:hypothetical protein
VTFTGDVSRDITAMEMSIMSKLTEAVLQNAASLEVAVNLAAQLGRKNRPQRSEAHLRFKYPYTFRL